MTRPISSRGHGALDDATGAPPPAGAAGPGRLTARPVPGTPLALPFGGSVLGDDLGLVHVPRAAAEGPVRLVVLLHGAGSTARAALGLLEGLADRHGLLLLATDARRPTWDLLTGGFGPDVAVLDAALHALFAACPVDPARVALGGFSDGASYALSLGLGNGDLLAELVAFSPGFARPGPPVGRPRIFVSHGRADAVLPIDRCSRRLVRTLRDSGYAVDDAEFDGGHVVPAGIAARAVAWLR